jgi:ribosomal protein S18 acetylase RimI-like enzyme
MEDILSDLSPEMLIRANEENLSAWIPIFGRLGQAHWNNPPGVKRSITNLPMSLFNSIMDARLVPEQTDAAIQSIVSDARARNVPLLWWIGPSTRPADLGKRLENHGFNFDETGPGMAVDLQKLSQSTAKPAGFSIQLAQGEAAWRQWSIVMALGFGAATANELSVNAWCSLLAQHPQIMLAYTGWLDDQPVSASLLLLAAGVAGIYCVATIPAARRKGIGAYMTLHPLIQARSMGYRIGVLQSSEMGLGVYRSLGFKEYCQIDSYFWRPEKSKAG